MSFTSPLALLLLLAVPYVLWLGWPRAARLRGQRRDRLSLGLRLLILLLLVFSLAGAQLVRAADDLAVVFLIDASDSISPAQAEQAEQFVRQAIAAMGPNDRAAVVVFGADALVERPFSPAPELGPITSVPQALHTDLARAMRLGLALFPAGSARRLVILSDGAATVGNTAGAAELAAAGGVSIDTVYLARPAVAVEAALLDVRAPARVSVGEIFTIEISAYSTADMAAELRVLAGGAVAHAETVQLRRGDNNFAVRLRAAQEEFARYRVQLTPEQDTFFQNNELAAFTEIVGAPRVLLVAADGSVNAEGAPEPDPAPQLHLALQATGLRVDRTTPANLPVDLGSLASYASVVLVDVNAKTLSPRKMETLQSFVRDLGGGLVVVGGPQSYGMGGYFGTPLEATLPVEMQIKDQERFPAVSIVLVIDRSGSMGQSEGGLTKIQLANEGAVRVVQLLNDFDEITVIPVDTQPNQVIGPLPASARAAAIERIRQIGAGGGGIYVRAGLEAAAEVLTASANPIKHVILLADGADAEQKEGVPALIEGLRAAGVTVSTVSIGRGPDTLWLQQMAELGAGRFHLTDQAANIPQIFTQETTAIQRSYLIEERFFPTQTGPSPILAGIRATPPLYGYVGTSPKAAAQLILTTHQGDPLLAAWQYGLGRAVAWTSDATGRWALEWVRWDGFAPFWAQAVRWTMSENRESRLETAVTYAAAQARLTVDARDAEGAFLNDLALVANVVDPSGQAAAVSLQQVAPGRYTADFTPGAEGAYFIRLAGANGTTADIGQTLGWVLGYSPEYRNLDANPQLLASLAALTGGRELAPAEGDGSATAVFDHNLPAQPAARPIWPWLTLLAVLLLPVDVGVRRLVVSRADLARAWAATFGRVLPQPTPVPARAERVTRLLDAKERAQTQRTAVTPPPQPEGSPQEPQTAAEKRPSASPAAPPPPAPGTLAARLREKRRQESDRSKS